MSNTKYDRPVDRPVLEWEVTEETIAGEPIVWVSTNGKYTIRIFRRGSDFAARYWVTATGRTVGTYATLVEAKEAAELDRWRLRFSP